MARDDSRWPAYRRATDSNLKGPGPFSYGFVVESVKVRVLE
jgi:hypothetical protein